MDVPDEYTLTGRALPPFTTSTCTCIHTYIHVYKVIFALVITANLTYLLQLLYLPSPSLVTPISTIEVELREDNRTTYPNTVDQEVREHTVHAKKHQQFRVALGSRVAG